MRMRSAEEAMSFKTKPSTCHIDLAPTNRARCRACKRPVPKDAVRIVTRAFVRPQRATSFVRCAPQCIDKAFATAVLDVYGCPERVPMHTNVPQCQAELVRAALGGCHADASVSNATRDRASRPIPPRRTCGIQGSIKLFVALQPPHTEREALVLP